MMDAGLDEPNGYASMSKPELEFHLPLGAWHRPHGAPHGVWEKILAHDPESGDRTLLQRFDSGADTRAQGTVRHDYAEEVYILDGEITDERLGRTFTAGMYASRPPGMPHGPWTSRGGALMFVVSVHRPWPAP